ncbi:unnamed protein product [Cylindrotheca closterium]|uniref:CSN8/PSMD8/EIF3K domain-containing protein n=1 Tax=Cylindrotheca closterium TaxID=2856 RepID=A0AAD2CH34_9STRA|nr:unnamed protein product [Cylindrotheca closterium]
MPTQQEIEKLLQKSPYSASNQATLEAYVDAQAQGQAPYYQDANRSLLRIYQFSSQSADPSKIALILMLALLEYPSTDILAFSYLVPARTQKVEPCASVLKCAKLLESCKFTEFWPAVAAIEGDNLLKNLVTNSTQKMQSAILEVLSLTYKSASVAKVSEALNVSSANAITKLSHPNVESVQGDKIIFVASSENTKRNRVFQEGVDFGAIASMMAKVTAE